MRGSRLAVVIVAVVVVVGAVVWGFVGREKPVQVGGPVAMSSPLPSIVMKTLDGATLDSATFRGRPTVINTWATWCGPCQQEQPALVSLAKRYGSRVRFVGIDFNDDEAKARRWVGAQFHVPYPSYYDASGRTAHLLNYPIGLPDTFVVDADGVIRWAIYGRTDEDELGGVIDQVLSAQASASPSA